MLSVLTAYLHYRHTGLTPYRYTTLVINTINTDASPIRQRLADVVRRFTLGSGLIKDPLDADPPDLQMPLPTWRGKGANALRETVHPRYRTTGEPIPLADTNLWILHEAQGPTREVPVESTDSLTRALASAAPGDRIILAPGHYAIRSPLTLGGTGSAQQPLQLTAARLGEAILTFKDGGSLRVNGSNWTVSDIVMRRDCGDAPCPAPVELSQRANHFTARNLFVTGASALLEPAKDGGPATTSLAEGITLLNGELSAKSVSPREVAIRRISRARADRQLITLCPTATTATDCDTTSLQDAAKQVAPGGLILLRQGNYRQAAHFQTPGVHLLAEPGARLVDTATGGKGAIVVSADITVEGLECSGITVSSGNGACLRQNRGDVTLMGVHFHHSQMGVLTGHEGGNISIYDSYLHDSGAGGRGNLGHNVYVNSGRLAFIRSWSLMARNAGHELKSRAAHTLIQDSLIASVNARDSRLVDVPDGGALEISGSVLGEGPRSENWDMIGYGLEIRDKTPPHAENVVRLVGNTFYSDRPQGVNLLNAANASDVVARDNVAVGLRNVGELASAYVDRDAAQVPPFPALQALAFQ
ncbi:hypothetical protein [Chromatocurvus halotolerans]|uniref:hypothetical protein n=1 Tax=Chromatocurvus halotolerans TaxID=1132028 RepID=UPI00104D6CEE|nr:hypothetical protein [Chromatocurvus halotolerans]